MKKKITRNAKLKKHVNHVEFGMMEIKYLVCKQPMKNDI